MFAVIETGGKQYKVSSEQKIRVEKLNGEKSAAVVFDKVLLWADGEKIKIGAPYVEGAGVAGEILNQGRDKKKIVFKYHSKNRFRKKKGHRQNFTEVKIGKITA
ncbi:MAG: 50S ribosomal protein L21 [Parcubacteria group bacterium]|nr:50S ribosomal protein L21 [Parcubacteria group bacterium]